MNNISISTAQNVVINYEAAGIGDRILATLIDILIKFAYVFVLVMMSFLFADLTEFSEDIFAVMANFIPIFYLPLMFYNLLCEIFMNGQSFGKKAMKIKVVKLDGSNPTLGSYLLRWVLRLIDIIICYSVVAFLLVLLTKNSQRLGDLAANTTVVRLKRRVNISDTIFENVSMKTHNVTYPQVEKLTDNDISILKEVVKTARSNDNPQLLNQLYVKMKETLNVEHEGRAVDFLNTLVKDYNFITGR